jgi:hypothetical protein
MFFWTDTIFDALTDQKVPISMVTSVHLKYTLVFISYLFCCFCLQRVLLKLDVQPNWLAWLPVANLWTIFKAGKMSPWWLMPLLLANPTTYGHWTGTVWWPLNLFTHQYAIIDLTAFLPAWATIIFRSNWIYTTIESSWQFPLSMLQLGLALSSLFALASAWITILKRLDLSPWLVILIFSPVPIFGWWYMYYIAFTNRSISRS